MPAVAGRYWRCYTKTPPEAAPETRPAAPNAASRTARLLEQVWSVVSLSSRDNEARSKTPAQRIRKHGSKAVVPQHQLPPVIIPTTSNSSKKTQNNGNVILIAGVAASLFLFWYLYLLTLNQMTQLSDGLAMPDSLVGGFSVDYVGELRARMNEDARGQLSYIHKTAGTLFPLIFGFSWLLLIGTNVASRVLRGLLWALPLLFIIIRLSANGAVDTALASPSLEPGTVILASCLTVAGWVLLLLSVIAGGAAVVLRRWALRQGRRP